MSKSHSNGRRLAVWILVALFVFVAAGWVGAGRIPPKPPFHFLIDLQLADSPFQTRDQRGHLCNYVYTGRADYDKLFLRATTELTAGGWRRNPGYPFSEDGCRFVKGHSTSVSEENWVMLKKDARVGRGNGRLITKKASGWVSVNCLLSGDAPGFWDRVRNGLHI